MGKGDDSQNREQEVEVGWCLIPPWVMADDDLTTAQKAVYGRVLGLSKDRGYCWAKNATLGAKLGLSARQVRRHLRKLERGGHVRRQQIRNASGVTVERRIYPRTPRSEGQEDASDRTPDPQEDVSDRGGADVSDLLGRTFPSTGVKQTSSETSVSETSGGQDRKSGEDGSGSDSEGAGEEPDEVRLPPGANLKAGFTFDCEACQDALRGSAEACEKHYVPTHERGAGKAA